METNSMSTFTLPVIGSFELPPDGVFEATVELHGRCVGLDINVYGAATQGLLDSVAGFVTNLAGLDQSARDFLSRDFEQNNESCVRLYIKYHLEVLDPDALRASLAVAHSQATDAKLFLSKINLCRVGLYPDSQDECAVFDYTIDERLTQYLIVVRFDSKGAIVAVDMES